MGSGFAGRTLAERMLEQDDIRGHAKRAAKAFIARHRKDGCQFRDDAEDWIADRVVEAMKQAINDAEIHCPVDIEIAKRLPIGSWAYSDPVDKIEKLIAEHAPEFLERFRAAQIP